MRDGAAPAGRASEREREASQRTDGEVGQRIDRERAERRRAYAERKRRHETRGTVDSSDLWVYRELLNLPPTTGDSYVDRHQRVFTTTDGRRWRVAPALGDYRPETGGEQYSCRANRNAGRLRGADRDDPEAYRKDAWGRRRCDIPPVGGPDRRDRE